MDKLCNCKELGLVARDMKSTCMKCGGIDAYKTGSCRKPVKNIDDKSSKLNKLAHKEG